MSHFTVLVIGDDPDELLAPYDENTKVKPYKEYYNAEEIKSMAEHYEIDSSDYEALTEKMPNWCGCEGGFDDKGLYKLTTYNPNSKWDWYEIGGRWPGMLKLKEGAEGNLGKPSFLFDSNEDKKELLQMVKDHKVSQAKVDSIDWEITMHNPERAAHLSDEWDKYMNGNWYLKPEYYIERYGTKEEFIKRELLFTTYAVITEDGEWHAPGDMGYWGFSSDDAETKRNWDLNYFNMFIKGLKSDTLLTIVDCHI